MNVKIECIPHKEQRYETVGDWFFDAKGDLVIRVSNMSNWRFEMLVAVHELVEVLLCKYIGVSQEAVDRFDKHYEKQRELGNAECQDEPGDDPRAPYAREHCIATAVERLLCAELGLRWNEYADEVERL